MTDVSGVGGQVLPGFGRVADAFAQNLSESGEVGAACSVYVDGELAVDLWGGLANAETGTSWGDQTIVMVYSTSKGLTAMCAHLLAQRGELDFDRPVADYWPEFAAHGKAEIPSVNAMTDARSLARVYAACVAPVAGCRILDADTISSAIKAYSDGP